MALHITNNIIDAMIAHAKREAPIEACGYLAGIDGETAASFPLTNADASHDHFTFIPAEQFAAVRTMRSRGLRPVAVYHSHPASPARPSQEDLRLLIDPQLSYVIVSLSSDNPVVKSFRIVDGVAVEEELIVD